MKTSLGWALCAAAVLASGLVGRAQEWAWATIMANGLSYGAFDGWGRNVAVDADGNAYIIASPIGILIPSLAKYDPEGNLVWSRAGWGDDVAVDQEGNLYVAGNFSGPNNVLFGDASSSPTNGTSDHVVLTNLCQNDGMFLVKFDPDGQVLWGQQASGLRAMGQGVATDAQGEVFVTGWFQEYATFSSRYAKDGEATNGLTFSLSSRGEIDTYLAKYDSRGNLLWAQNGGGLAVAADPEGNVCVVGSFSGILAWDGPVTSGTPLTISNTVETVTNVVGAVTNIVVTLTNTLAAITNSDGAVTYTLVMVTNTVTTISNIVVVVTNAVHSITNVISAGSSDMYVFKYGPSGNPLWALTRSPGDSTSGHAIALDGAGNIFTECAVGTPTNVWFSVDKFSPAGDPAWPSRIISGPGLEGPYYGLGVSSLAVTTEGRVCAAGAFTGSNTFGDTTLTAEGLTGVFVLEFSLDGQVLWVKQAGGFESADTVCVAAGPRGDLWVAGNFFNSMVVGGTTLTATFRHIFLARLAAGLPSITGEPQNLRASLGATASFCVAVTNAPNPHYQWLKDGVSLADNERLSGAAGPCLTIANVQTSDLGNYSVIIQTDSGAVSSSPAALWLGPLTQFVSTTMLPNGTLQVDFTGQPGVLYNIEGATNLSFDYAMVLTNFYCSDGAIRIIDWQAPQYPIRFYRAVGAKH